MKPIRVNFPALGLARRANVLWTLAVTVADRDAGLRLADLAVRMENKAYALGGSRRGDRASRRVFRRYQHEPPVLRGATMSYLAETVMREIETIDSGCV